MSALTALQQALVTALTSHPDISGKISGVFDGPPPRAPFPYIAMSESLTTDWGGSVAPGREVRIALTIWDDGEAPARLHGLVAAVEAAVAGLPRTLPGWRITSIALNRSLIIRDAAGPWAGLVDHRIRLLAT
jgi:Protein of unknown function (DUF3168)